MPDMINFDLSQAPFTGYVELTKSNGQITRACQTKSKLGRSEEVLYILKIQIETKEHVRNVVHAYTKESVCKYHEVGVIKVEFKTGFKLLADLKLALEVEGGTAGAVSFV